MAYSKEQHLQEREYQEQLNQQQQELENAAQIITMHFGVTSEEEGKRISKIMAKKTITKKERK